MEGIGESMNWEKVQDMEYGKEEKILVLVRLRPLSDKEIAQGEVAEWECSNSTTVLCRNSLQERSGLPTAFSFDRVFNGDCTTRQVYEKGAKDISLSVVAGINSTIFAYGQTSSGKTYTMDGITELAITDIYDYIQRHEERAFALKFSAIEIYNEVVRDLLSTDNTSLRLLDDPERGTILEKLTEETLRDQNHLMELLSICNAQRQIGETVLNEASSRSHQILRLTVESSAREFLGKSNSTALAASVNFVDLAGSERASQVSSVGQRLKEGCHINRSLLTLATVIRKLSKGRHGHVNYRDSKLTRILQPALGGNARTAIICTLCPSRMHVEQSKNTLLFASCAKEVSTNAHVNIVMSDKALVKHLQKEVARLEGELRTPGSVCDHASMLRKKDIQIEQMEKEVNELKKQLGFAHTRIENLTKVAERNEQNGNPYSSDPSQGTGNDEDCDDIYKEVRCIEITTESFGTSIHEEEESSDVDDHILTFPPQGMPSNFRLLRSQSCRANLVRRSPCSDMTDHTPSSVIEKNFTGKPEGGFLIRKQLKLASGANSPKLTRNDSPPSDNIPTLGSFIAGLRELAKLQNESRSTNQVREEVLNVDDNSGRESLNFERMQNSIVQLWNDCYVPLIHRTYFVLLVKNDPSDSVYMEVEYRRLSFLKDTFSRGKSIIQDGRTLTLASSKKGVSREREMMSRLVHKRYTLEERNKLYKEWGINVNSKKRRLQLVHLIWSETENMEHVQNSVATVAKLIGFLERGEAMTPKEMFGLSFTPLPLTQRSFSWKSNTMSLLS